MLWIIEKVAWLATLVHDNCSPFDEDRGWRGNGMCKAKVYLQGILFHQSKVE